MVRPALSGPAAVAQHDIGQLKKLKRTDGGGDQHEGRHGADARQGHRPELLPSVGAVGPWAASYSSRSTACSAARKYTMLNPTYIHRDVITRAGITQLGLVSHSVSSEKPGMRECRTRLMRPNCGTNNTENSTPTKDLPQQVRREKCQTQKIAGAQPGLVQQQCQPQCQWQLQEDRPESIDDCVPHSSMERKVGKQKPEVVETNKDIAFRAVGGIKCQVSGF